MKIRADLRRLLKNERGFSLPELLVTMLMMLTVMFALYSIFDMSLRVFSFGNDKIEAVENARIGLERMEREIRAAYPQTNEEGQSFLLGTTQAGKISFGNDLDGNGQVSGDENITYELYPSPGNGVKTLGRAEGGGNNQAVAENFRDGGLEFGYCRSVGDCPEGLSENGIRVVRVTLTVEVEDGTQTLTTDVALRNARGEGA